MKRAIYQTFFLIHTLSIDIALGAVGLGWAILKIFTHKLNILGPIQSSSTLDPSSKLTLKPKLISTLTLDPKLISTLQNSSTPILLLLFLGTLIVYWTDHLQDSKNIQMVVRDERHALFFRNRRWFEVGLGIMILLSAYIALTFLTWIQLVFGLLLLALHAGYLLFHRMFNRKVILEKELWVGFLYTLSILFVPLAICMPFNIWQGLEILLLGLLVFLVCMQNLFSIARMEREEDEAMGARNGVLVFGELRMKGLQKLMLLLQVVSSLLLMLATFLGNMEDIAGNSEMGSKGELASAGVITTTGEIVDQTEALIMGDATWLMSRLLAAFMIVGFVNYLLPWLFGSDRKNSWYRIVGDGIFLFFFLV